MNRDLGTFWIEVMNLRRSTLGGFHDLSMGLKVA